jgi:hypothetical protein
VVVSAIFQQQRFLDESVTLPQKGELECVLVDELVPDPGLRSQLLASFDELCPELSSSPSLQHRALRVVASTGIDAFLVDCEVSLAMGPLRLKEEDLLSSDQTENIFGQFEVPISPLPQRDR